MSSEIKVDTISEKTSANGVTIDGVLIKDGSINANGTGRKNYIINGNFDIWQRGTSLTGGGALNFLADRWQFEGSGAIYNLSQGTFTVGQTDVPNNPKYYLDITVTSADDLSRLEQNIEEVSTLSGENVTVSFWAKYTTNAPTNFNTYLIQKFGSGGSADVTTTLATGQTLTTSWQKFTLTTTLPSISGKTVGAGSSLMLRPFWNPNNETYDVQIAQVQVEKGSVATDFEVRPIGEELSLCERYYQYANTGSRYVINGALQSTTEFRGLIPSTTTMRTTPTVSLGTSQVLVNNGGYDNDGVTISSVSNTVGGIAVTIATAATSGSFQNFQSASLRAATYELDAEL